jgi:molybdopterin-guanine dinucleotide biosynthesis protein A
MASAAILVGGLARRFGGRDKSALVVEGRSILERQLQALAPITDDVMIVGADPADLESRFRKAIDAGSHIRAIADRIAGSGPLGGLDAALAAARDDALILIACDMPFVETAFLQYLVAESHGVDAVVPRTDRGYHPLCAVYTRACRGAVSERLGRRDLALSGLIQAVRARLIVGEEIERFGPARRLLANVNTPGEFDELEALLDHKL